MININFDNPYLLLLAIPLLAFVLVPIAIAIKRDNRSKSVIASVIMHIVMVLCITLAVAGMDATAVVTETQVYVLADVSYSAHANLDKVAAYVREVEDNLPTNSKMGVICFGKDYEINTPLGEDFVTVSGSNIDDSATNIAPVLKYAGTLFGEETINRIVLITDGKETDSDTTNLVNAITDLYNAGVKIDVMYMDNNAASGVKETQLSGVDYSESTYSNADSNEASVLVQSSVQTQGYVVLYDNGVEVRRIPKTFDVGYNIVNIDLRDYCLQFEENETSKVKNFKVKVEANDDTSHYNDEFTFTQKVTKTIRVLALTEIIKSGNKVVIDDTVALKELYKELVGEAADATMETGLVIKNLTNVKDRAEVPTSVEELCEYDQIVLSNVNVTKLTNCNAFLDSLNKVVLNFGKTLLTIGDVQIQNDATGDLEILDSMLPVQFGDNDTEKKLLGIIVDISRSMFQIDRMTMAKRAAKHLLNLVGPNDEVAIVAFSSSSRIVVSPTAIETEDDKKKIEDIIDNELNVSQGTYIGDAMNTMYKIIASSNNEYAERQVMLLSDGLNYAGNAEYDPKRIAGKLYGEFNTPTSTIGICSTSTPAVNLLQEVITYGRGSYYQVAKIADLDKLMLEQVAPDIKDTEVKVESAVHVVKQKDEVLMGIPVDESTGEVSFNKIDYYVNSTNKQSAKTVLTVDYTRPSGSVVQSPLYAYWNYGKGKVASFTGRLTGNDAKKFMDEKGMQLISNMISTNVPEERVDYPYNISVGYDGLRLNIEVIPVAIDPNAEMKITLTSPDGTSQESTLYFTTTNFYGSFDCLDIGKYTIDLEYIYNGISNKSQVFYDLSYSNEYDAFTAYDSAVLYSSVRNMGKITENGTVNLENDEKELETYTLDMAMPLMIFAVSLYVIDIAVRKLKKEDILSLFARKSKDKEGK